MTAHEHKSEARGLGGVPIADSDPDGTRWAMTIVLFCAFFAILLFLVPFHE